MHWSAWSCLAATLVACGGSPASPDPVTAIVALGPQVLRITPISPPCRVFPLYTRVTVSRSGNGWLATASSAAAGDVQVRFQPSAAAVIPGTLPVEGTVTGTALHMPELLNVPTGDLRASFGSGTVLEGFAFSAGAMNMTTAGLDGVGTGPVSVVDASAVSCAVTRFSWSIFPPQ